LNQSACFLLNNDIMAKKKKNTKTEKDEDKFDIKINEFGQIVTSYSIDKLNAFLDENVEDKKLKDRSDLKNKKEEEE
jgi:DNA replication protein DnaD